MPFGSFADLAKWAYVDVAVRDFGAKGGKQSTSRIFILNSLSRREVSQLRITEALCDSVEVDRYNRAVCVIGG